MTTTSNNILIINGSLRGAAGNSGALAKQAAQMLKGLQQQSSVLTLTDPLPTIREVYELLAGCDGFVVITGVYWNNWSSPLQRFIEVTTALKIRRRFWANRLPVQ